MNPGSGWNTWSWRSYARLCLLREAEEVLSVGVATLDELSGELRLDFGAAEWIGLGPRAEQCGSFTFSGGFESPFRLEWCAEGEALWLRVVPVRSTWRRPVVFVSRPASARHRRDDGGSRVEVGEFVARAFGFERAEHIFVGLDSPYWVGRKGESLLVVVRATDESAEQGHARIDRALQHSSVQIGKGDLAEAADVVRRVLQWNCVLHPREGKPAVVATREWCRDWQGVLLFGWDSLLTAAMASAFDPKVAWTTLECCLEPVDELGFVPNWSMSNGARTMDRSHPPLGALAALRVMQAAPDRERLQRLYPRLLRWHDWWKVARDRGDGLLAWGSSGTPRWKMPQVRQAHQGGQITGAWESGQDNSPVFDAVEIDERRGTLVDADVGLNALFALDAEILAILAGALDDSSTQARLREEHELHSQLLSQSFWDPSRGIFANRRKSSEFVRSITPTSLWPLLTGRIGREQVDSVLGRLLDHDRRLGGEWRLPSVTRDDPAFADNDYWRGRIWPPLNFLSYLAMRRAGETTRASSLAQSSLALFLKGWREEHGVFENYNAVTGEGGDVHNSDRLYTWGGLLAFVAMIDVLDIDVDGALRVGVGAPCELRIERGWIDGARWTLEITPRSMEVWKEGQRVLRCRPSRLRLHKGQVEIQGGDPGTMDIEWHRLPRCAW